MKKIFALSLILQAALGLRAQYTCPEPFAAECVDPEEVRVFDVVVGADVVIGSLLGSGQKVNDLRPNGATRFFSIEEESFIEDKNSFPGVGFSDLHVDGYPSLTVADKGWSLAGFSICPEDSLSTNHWTDETCFHVAYRTNGTAPSSLIFKLGSDSNTDYFPAVFTVGQPFNDNGAIRSSVGPDITKDWIAVDISFAQLKKICPSFSYQTADRWTGEIVSLMAGGIEGRNVCLDCMYFHTPYVEEDALGLVETIPAVTVTESSVYIPKASSVEIYDLTGRLLKKVSGEVLDLDGIAHGVYIINSAGITRKILR